MSHTACLQRLVGLRVTAASHVTETDPETGIYDEHVELTFENGMTFVAFSNAGGYSLDFVIKEGGQ